MRDEIQPKGLMICAALRASRIYQSCGLDKKIDKSELVEFFGAEDEILAFGGAPRSAIINCRLCRQNTRF